MKLRLFVPILFVVPALAACGSSSGSSGAASAQAKAIASAEAQGAAAASSSPGAGASTDAPSDGASSAASSGSGSDTCPDQTISGYKISNVLLTEGATCAQLGKVAAAVVSKISGPASNFAAAGFQCDVEAVNLVSCDEDGSQAEINFNADKQ
jgi:hypothetical protein